MFKRLSIFVSMAVLSACTTPNNVLLRAEKQEVQGASVVVIRRPFPTFYVTKTSDGWLQIASAGLALPAMWAVTGAVVALAQARSDPFVEEHKLTDPARAIAASLGHYFGPKYGAIFAGLTDDVLENSSPEDIALTLRDKAKFALDIRTGSWGLSPSLMGNYRFVYAVVFVLIELEKENIIASGRCVYSTPSESAKDYNAFIENEALFLKSEIDAATDSCSAQFAEDILAEKDAMPSDLESG